MLTSMHKSNHQPALSLYASPARACWRIGAPIALAIAILAATGCGDKKTSNTLNVSGPVTIKLGTLTFERFSAGGTQTCVINEKNFLYCWGRNLEGQVGNGGTADVLRPTQIGTQSDWKSISAGFLHTCGLRMNGDLYCWGANADGRLGDNTIISKSSPVRIGDKTWSNISAGRWKHTCGIQTNNTLWCWGDAEEGALGMNNIDGSNVLVPTQVVINPNSESPRSEPELSASDTDWLRVYAGEAYTCALKLDRSIWCWGQNNNGQSGVMHVNDEGAMVERVDIPLPRQVGVAKDWQNIGLGDSHACAVNTSGALWCWGESSAGRLGVPDVSVLNATPRQVSNASGEIETSNEYDALVPTRVGTGTDWSQLPEGIGGGRSHTCAIQGTTQLWCWGINTNGQLGVGDNVQREVPNRIDDNINWKAVSTGDHHTCAVSRQNNDDVLYCWGNNIDGAVGDGTSTEATSPVELVIVVVQSTEDTGGGAGDNDSGSGSGTDTDSGTDSGTDTDTGTTVLK